MAIDEAILRELQRQGSDIRPTLRLYGWKKPSVSLGYFQNVTTEVNIPFCHRNDIPIIRRPTGGKAVLHDDDLTYAVIAREDDRLFPGGLVGTYKVISQCIAAGLEKLGVRADMVEEGRPSDGADFQAFCFSTPSQHELLVEKRKICGSAQIRSKGVFLQHGSLLMSFDPLQTCRTLIPSGADAATLQRRVTSLYEYADRAAVDKGICAILKEAFEECLGIRLIDGSLTEAEEKTKSHLLNSKYRDSRWNMEGKRLYED
jgi:lipoate-protein ligase A